MWIEFYRCPHPQDSPTLVIQSSTNLGVALRDFADVIKAPGGLDLITAAFQSRELSSAYNRSRRFKV